MGGWEAPFELESTQADSIALQLGLRFESLEYNGCDGGIPAAARLGGPKGQWSQVRPHIRGEFPSSG